MSGEGKVCSKAEQCGDFCGYDCLSVKKNNNNNKNYKNEENPDDGTQRFRESLAR